MSSDLRNLLITIILSTGILFAWQYFFELPKIQEKQRIEEISKQQAEENKRKEIDITNKLLENSNNHSEIETSDIKIETDKLHGSISLKGLRFNNITLAKYKQNLNEDSKEVQIFSPANMTGGYFAEFGWVSSNKNINLPNRSSVWTADKSSLKPNEDVHLKWQNDAGVIFNVAISIDENYMFTVKQSVINNSEQVINVVAYGLISRSLTDISKPFMVLHEGLVGTFNGILKEVKYEDLIKEKLESFESTPGGWLGITDKYWLTALIPDSEQNFQARFTNISKDNKNTFQADFWSKEALLTPHATIDTTTKMFVGPKTASLLDKYEAENNIKLFDRAIDYGWFYFLTKPLFTLLTYLNSLVGNYGIAILLMTLVVKLLLFPIANKSFHSMSKMKKVQPELNRLKELYGQDKVRMNQEVMALYKREKINPLSGCLPLIIQIPVFFSLYKVIFISIEMRHAPFFGWIKDLSAPDPTSFLNLFGLLPFEAPEFLPIGILPIIMGLTMFLQQKMSPQPADPVQAKVMKFLPLIFVFLFHSFPSGLMVYWSFSNILSILQQYVIQRSLEKHEAK